MSTTDVYTLYDNYCKLKEEQAKLIKERESAPHDSELWNYGYEEIAYMQADIDGYREEIEEYYLSQPSDARYKQDDCIYELFFAELLGYYLVTCDKKVIGLFECAEADSLKRFREIAKR